MSKDFSASPIEPSESLRLQHQEQLEAQKMAWAAEMSQNSMKAFGDEAAFSPIMMSRRFQSLEEKRRKDVEKKEGKETEEKHEISRIEEITSLSEEYERHNPELHARSLQRLISQIRGEDSREELLRKVLQNFPDHSLADETLEFLERITTGDILSRVREAKDDLNATFGREVRAGRNMGQQARLFSSQGLGSPTALRDIYREITGNPRDAPTLFMEMNEKFTYAKMQTAIDFLLHSLGADLKSKGPSIAPGELHRLMTESRNLLAVLWVYRFFRGRMDLINSSYERAGMLLPSRITFEMLAKMFVQFLLERYPSMDKVFQLALKMGISADLIAQVILFTQMRDAVRGVAPKLFRSEQHRHDILMSFIEALEELDEKIEEEEEKKEDQEKEEEEEEK